MNGWMNMGHISLVWIAEVWAITAQGIEAHYVLIAGATALLAELARCEVAHG